MSRSKEAVYRESGEEAYDEAGSPQTGKDDPKGQGERKPDAAVTLLDPHRSP